MTPPQMPPRRRQLRRLARGGSPHSGPPNGRAAMLLQHIIAWARAGSRVAYSHPPIPVLSWAARPPMRDKAVCAPAGRACVPRLIRPALCPQGTLHFWRHSRQKSFALGRRTRCPAPGAQAALSGRSLALRAPGAVALRATAAAQMRRIAIAAAIDDRFSPAAPPPLPPPLGALGERRADFLGCAQPAVAMRRQGVDKSEHLCYYVCAGPVSRVRKHSTLWVSVGRQNPPWVFQGGFFLWFTVLKMSTGKERSPCDIRMLSGTAAKPGSHPLPLSAA